MVLICFNHGQLCLRKMLYEYFLGEKRQTLARSRERKEAIAAVGVLKPSPLEGRNQGVVSGFEGSLM